MATIATIAQEQETKKASYLTPQRSPRSARSWRPRIHFRRAAHRRGGRAAAPVSNIHAFENQGGMMDKSFAFDDLKVFVDATSSCI